MGLAGFTQSAETMTVMGVLLKPITQEFAWSRTTFTGAMTLGTLLGGILAIGIGPIIDRWGGRWSLVIAFFILGSTLVLMSVISSLWQFYSLQITGRMILTGVIGLTTSVVIPKWFISKRGRAVALGAVGSRIGSTITPLYMQLLVSTMGWRISTIAAGIVMWALSILPVAIFLKRSPEDIGLLPDGRIETPSISSPNHPTNLDTASTELSLSLSQVIRLPSFYLLITALFLAFVFVSSLNLHTIPYFTDKGIKAEIAVLGMALSAGVSGFATIGIGFLAERYTSKITLVTSLIATTVGIPILLLSHSENHVLLWGIYFGLMVSGIYTSQQLIFADFYGRKHLGSIRGLVMPAQLLSIAIGPIGASIFFDISRSYIPIFIIFGMLSFIASILVLLAHPPSTTIVKTTHKNFI